MHTYFEIMLRKDISISMQFTLKMFSTLTKNILIHKTHSLNHRHVHHKTNNAKLKKVNIHVT